MVRSFKFQAAGLSGKMVILIEVEDLHILHRNNSTFGPVELGFRESDCSYSESIILERNGRIVSSQAQWSGRQIIPHLLGCWMFSFLNLAYAISSIPHNPEVLRKTDRAIVRQS